MKNIWHRLPGIGTTLLQLAVAAAVPPLLPELERISRAWLAHKKTDEKGFSLGFFNPDYLIRFPCAVLRQDGKIIVFANVWHRCPA